MAANGGGPPPPPPFIKREQDSYDGGIQSKPPAGDDDDHNNNIKGISIAERRAAKCGFNAASINAARFGTCSSGGGLSPQVRSPYVTIPAGISPSALLDSPIMLPNAQAQLSPTTGTFHHQLLASPNHESLKLKLKLDSTPADNFTAHETLPFNEYFEYSRDFRETSRKDCNEDNNTLAKTDDQCLSLQQPSNIRSTVNPNIYQEKHHPKGAYIPKEVAKHSEDGFYWRKYGQKHVKGSEYPRSYYKCTNANCLVKKKVERSHAGEITEIVYKGSHNHPIPHPFFNSKRFNDVPDQMAIDAGGGATTFKAEGTNDVVAFGSEHWMPDGTCLDGATSASILSDFSDNPVSVSNFDQPVDQMQEFSSNNPGSQDGEDQNQASPESVTFKDEDDENGDCEPKKRKRENNFPSETAIPRSARETKVVVQIESDVDILDDGYRWRKYGQKVVKGNPNPRSYYKCTTPGCLVRKHVERDAENIKFVLTAYEGKHNHDVPTSKTGSHVISDHAANLPSNNAVASSSAAAQKHDHMSLKAGKHVQDIPLYMERKPILSYNELMMRSNMSGNFASTHHDLGFGAPPPLYPYSFPPFPSLSCNSVSMNGNNMNINNHMTSSYPPSKLYPMMLPDYTIPLPSQHMNHFPAGGSGSMPIGGNFGPLNNYAPATLENSSRGGQDQTGNIVKPKKEQTEDEGELYDTCLSIPNHGNGSL